MTPDQDLPPELTVEINAHPAARVAARLVVALEEIEHAAYYHGLHDVGHLAEVAGLAAWEHAGRKRSV